MAYSLPGRLTPGGSFTTIAGSRILTPDVMGFDSQRTLIQTMIVYAFGGTRW